MQAQKMAGHLIRRLHQVSTQVFVKQVQKAGFDVTPVQFAAMDSIASNPGIDQAKVATLIAYDRATIGGVIGRLELKGWADRAVNQRDQRAREVRLTPDGMAVYQSLLPVVEDLQDDILAPLDPEEKRTFLALAKKALEG